MQRDSLLSKGLDNDIVATHRRFLAAMDLRLPNMSRESKERYFVVLSSLVGKLECDTKSLRDVLREMTAEVASIMMQEIGAS